MFNLQHTEELSEHNLQVCSGYQTVVQTNSLLTGVFTSSSCENEIYRLCFTPGNMPYGAPGVKSATF